MWQIGDRKLFNQVQRCKDTCQKPGSRLHLGRHVLEFRAASGQVAQRRRGSGAHPLLAVLQQRRQVRDGRVGAQQRQPQLLHLLW